MRSRVVLNEKHLFSFKSWPFAVQLVSQISKNTAICFCVDGRTLGHVSNQQDSLGIPKHRRHNFSNRVRNFGFFYGGLARFIPRLALPFCSGVKWCIHVSSPVTIRSMKLECDSARWYCDRKDKAAPIRCFLCSSVNKRGTHRADNFRMPNTL